MSNHVLASLVLAVTGATASTAFAADPATQASAQSQGGLSRSQVVQETLMARRSGQLRPVGEAAEATLPYSVVSRADRADVKTETVAGRSNRTLVPAGQAVDPVASRTFVSAKTRAQVNAETRTARFDGTLLPAGESVEPARSGNRAFGTAQARR